MRKGAYDVRWRPKARRRHHAATRVANIELWCLLIVEHQEAVDVEAGDPFRTCYWFMMACSVRC
jgi:hypothetical protein